jgi:hypothetical protein
VNEPRSCISSPAGNTSDALECGFYGNGMVTEDFTVSEVQQRQQTVVPDIEKVPLQGPARRFSVPVEAV